MIPNVRALSLLVALIALVFLLAPAAAADTLIVDQSGPAGAFLTVQDALDAASDGDIIRIRNGAYAGFVIDRPVTVVAEQISPTNNVQITGPVFIHGIDAGETASITALTPTFLYINDCAGTVMGSDVHVHANNEPPIGPGDQWTMEVVNCADVRLHALAINGGIDTGRDGLRVLNSRMEIETSSIDGANGVKGVAGAENGGSGGVGILVGSGSLVHHANGRVRGGWGGRALFSPEGVHWTGGDGAEGFVVRPGGELVFNGIILSEIFGGGAGIGSLSQSGSPNCPLQGDPATAVRVLAGGNARIDPEVQIIGGFGGCIDDAPPTTVTGTLTDIIPRETNLHFDGGIELIGFTPSIDIFDVAGAKIILLAGLEPLLAPFPEWGANPLLVEPLTLIVLGSLPASGEGSVPVTIPATLPVGLTMIMQAASIRPDDSQFLSNSVTLVTVPPSDPPCEPIPCGPTK